MVNYLAILVVSVIYYLIQTLWYSPILFLNQWKKLSGIKDMKPTMGVMAIGFISVFVSLFVLSFIIDQLTVVTFVDGMLYGALVWLGFIVTTHMGSFLYEKKPFAFYLLNMVQFLITFVIAGGILAIWH